VSDVCLPVCNVQQHSMGYLSGPKVMRFLMPSCHPHFCCPLLIDVQYGPPFHPLAMPLAMCIMFIRALKLWLHLHNCHNSISGFLFVIFAWRLQMQAIYCAYQIMCCSCWNLRSAAEFRFKNLHQTWCNENRAAHLACIVYQFTPSTDSAVSRPNKCHICNPVFINWGIWPFYGIPQKW